MASVISIIIPIYDVEKYLCQCLNSVIEQTYKNIEIILIDDGSPDECGVICDKYAEKDTRIVVIHKKNEGVSKARNKGIDIAHGKWIMFVDPDDWLEPDCCEKIIHAEKNGVWDVIYFQRKVASDTGIPIQEKIHTESLVLNKTKIRKLQLDWLVDQGNSLGISTGTPPWGKVYRRSFLNDNNCRFISNIKRKEDLLFNLLCTEHLENAYCLNYIGYVYRRRKSSMCRNYNPDMLDILLDFLAEIDHFVENYHFGDEDFERRMGAQVVLIHNDLRRTIFFHRERHITREEYQSYMQKYYNDPIVKKYIKKGRTSDCYLIKDKIMLFLIKHKFINVYYYSCLLAYLKKDRHYLDWFRRESR